MLTVTQRHLPHSPALKFVLGGMAWSLGLFGLLRLPWFETHALLPLTLVQARLAEATFGTAATPIAVTLACSGADVLSMCAGAILAYPVRWRTRLSGAALGVMLVLALNTVRIGTLGLAAAQPLFGLLHVYVWPALLVLAVAAYVFAWIGYADRPRAAPSEHNSRAAAPALPIGVLVGRRLLVWTTVFLALFTLGSSVYMESALVLSLATFIAGAAAMLLGLFGVVATVSGNVLVTERGAFLVTQECIATPLIPLYLAVIVACLHTWPRRVLALLAFAPLFLAVGIARLLVVALPAAIVSSPAFAVHAFSQLLVGAVAVCLVAMWRHGAGVVAGRRAVLGAVLGGIVLYVLGTRYGYALGALFGGRPLLEDPQGAISLLPAFQVGLYVAVFVAGFLVLRWPLFAGGLAALGALQVALFGAIQLLARYAAFAPHAREVRAWAIAGPLLVVAALVSYDRSRR